MIPLKTGPYLALDASSSGDSYFVKIKLKSISNMPGVCCSQGAGEALALAPTQPWRAGGVDSGLRVGPWPRTVEGLVLEEGEGRRAGLLSEALNQNRAHEGQPTVAPCKGP